MIYDEEKDRPAKAQSSNLNEELGMVSYIFSDKTGTLTQNVMEFKKFSVGYYSYGESNPDPNKQKYETGVTNVNFYDAEFYNEWPNASTDNYDNIVDYINILAICHTIIVEVKDGIPVYNASSPDELALTNAARHFGVIFENRDENSNVIVYNKHTKERKLYQLMNVIEFTSTRKRMSVIVKSPDGKLICMTKGADSVIIPRLHPGQDKLVKATLDFIDEFANEGLRTLLVAQKEIDPEFYKNWNKKYQETLVSLSPDREKQINDHAELIEKDFRLVGSTAIEDKLQEEVGEVIHYIK